MRRREFITLVGGAAFGETAAAWPVVVRAQQKAMPVIGFLYPGVAAAAPTRIAAIRDGMRAVGYGDAGKVEFLSRFAEGDPGKLAQFATDLIGRKVDLLVPVAFAATRAAKAVTTTIPIVAHDLESDPVAAGLVSSIARPGGNITGLFSDFPNIAAKWLELLKEAMPTLSRAVVLRDPVTSLSQMAAVEAAARLLNIKLEVMDIRTLADLQAVFAAASESRPDALILLTSPIFGTNPKLVAELSLAHRLPIVTLFSEVARAGGLMTYGPNLLSSFVQLGTMVGKVLKGARPADLPVERPTKFELVINLKTANALGLTMPLALLARADEVIQ